MLYTVMPEGMDAWTISPSFRSEMLSQPVLPGGFGWSHLGSQGEHSACLETPNK